MSSSSSSSVKSISKPQEKHKIVYYGEVNCYDRYKSSGKPCQNKAYFQVGDLERYCCGMHKCLYAGGLPFRELPMNPNAAKNEANKIATAREEIERVAAENRSAKIPGRIVLSKLRMMKPTEPRSGYLNVYPNYKHEEKKDGFGCKYLSPKAMGPINHPQPGLPPAKNLENFHQGNKVFPSQFNQKEMTPTPEFYTTQQKMYVDSEPMRHHPATLHGTTTANKNIPVCSIWRQADGTRKHMTYLQSRQFYCTYYTRFALNIIEFSDTNEVKDCKAKSHTAFLRLKKYLADGYNLQICGFDAYPVDLTCGEEGQDDETRTVASIMEQCYLDTSRPFGHELVLFTLLVIDDPKQYPWFKHKTEIF